MWQTDITFVWKEEKKHFEAKYMLLVESKGF
jgi:hypothetical protein